MKIREVISQQGTSISSYGAGGFRLGRQKYTGSILITPRGYYPWMVGEDSAVTLAGLKQIIDQQQDIDILLVGTGVNMMPVSGMVQVALNSENIAVEVMATGAAVRTYNVLLMEGRKIAAALMAID